MSKTQQKKLLNMVKTMLTHRRNGHLNYEQSAWERLNTECVKLHLDIGVVIEQATEWLKRNSIAASMNGLV
jgi:hypothetical protein